MHVTVLHPITSSDISCRLLRVPRVRAKHYHTLMLAAVSVDCSNSGLNDIVVRITKRQCWEHAHVQVSWLAFIAHGAWQRRHLSGADDWLI